MLQQYDFVGSRIVNTKGDFFRYQSGSAAGQDNAIVLRVDNIPVGKYSPGDMVKFPDPHSNWSIEPVNANCVGVVVIGFGSVESASMSGTVQTVDGGKARSAAGVAMCAHGAQPGVASQFSYVQLYNQSADKNIILNAMMFSSAAQQSARVRHSAAPIVAGGGGVINTGLSKAGAAISSQIGVIKGVNNAASGAYGSADLLAFGIQANNTVIYRPTEPFIVKPGYGIVVCGYVAASDLGVTFEWFEEVA
jgi:hypothetical protein